MMLIGFLTKIALSHQTSLNHSLSTSIKALSDFPPPTHHTPFKGHSLSSVSKKHKMNQLLSFLSLLLLFLSQCTTTLAQSPAQPPAPSGPPNIMKILQKAGQFTVFLRLLGTTQVGVQINGQLNDTNSGMTVFAPSDNAFSSLQAGTLNSLTDEQKVELVQFHVLPSFYSISQLQTVSNPVRTQAGDTKNGQFPLNLTTSGNQVNISTGIVNTTVDNSIYTDSQLAVYQVDKVLLPLSIFGTQPPAPAPAPEAPKKKKSTTADSSSSDATDSSAAACLSMHAMVVVLSIGVAVIAAFLL